MLAAVGCQQGVVRTHLFPMVQAFMVIFKSWNAFGLAAIVVLVGVYDIAGQEFLPKRKAARRAWTGAGSATKMEPSGGAARVNRAARVWGSSVHTAVQAVSRSHLSR